MMNDTQRKVLLAVDGSDQSLEAVRYVSRIFPPRQTTVVLFHSFGKIPEFLWDLGTEGQRRQEYPKWETELLDSIHDFMSYARQILVDSGIPDDAIDIHIRERKVGIARDIILESHKGYVAVVVGRRGLNEFNGFVLGSVASKLFEMLTHVPICFVGNRPDSAKILLAVDESQGAMRAVDYTATMLKSSASEITLSHVVRGLYPSEKKSGSVLDFDLERKWLEEAKNETVFDKAMVRLVKAGLESKNVTTKLITGVNSRSVAILHEARKGRYGTIVIGRRGLSKVEEFSMGRVCRKVVELAKNKAVWVVS
jgi:nucleotide-binding universal stress UspA family protein